MSLDVDFRVKLSLIAGAGVPVQQNYASEDKTQPRIWYQRAMDEGELFLDGAPGQRQTVWAVEVAGIDPEETGAIYERLVAPAGQGGLDGFRGPMTGSRVLGIFVEDASDLYERRGLDLDDGYHSFTFSARIIT